MKQNNTILQQVKIGKDKCNKLTAAYKTEINSNIKLIESLYFI